MDRFVFKITTAFLLIFSCVACSSSVHTDPVKVDDYLYEISFSDYDFDDLSSIADRIFLKKGNKPSASCSAVRKDTLFGRNFDWAYDKMLEFIIRTGASEGRFASIGIASPIGVFEEDQINTPRGKMLLNALPIFTVDGINEKGVACCVNVVPPGDCGYTLNTNPEGKPLCAPLIVRLVLDKAGSAKEAIEMVRDRNIYTTMMDKLQTEYHFMIADSEGDYAVFEYWGRGTEESPYKLYVMRRDERFHKTGNNTYYGVPYEYNSIENYYCNPEAAFTYNQDKWQFRFSNKVRVHHMMSAYKPIMSEKEALMCLQEGSFGIEEPDDVTNWSCIYNPSERTMLFNMRNDLSEVYSIDLKVDL